jgi:hypothetical protein
MSPAPGILPDRGGHYTKNASPAPYAVPPPLRTMTAAPPEPVLCPSAASWSSPCSAPPSRWGSGSGVSGRAPLSPPRRREHLALGVQDQRIDLWRRADARQFAEQLRLGGRPDLCGAARVADGEGLAIGGPGQRQRRGLAGGGQQLGGLPAGPDTPARCSRSRPKRGHKAVEVRAGCCESCRNGRFTCLPSAS